MDKNELKYDAYIHWQLLRECTFSCAYCIAPPQIGKARNIDIHRVIDRLDKFNKTFLITLTGGEPFLIPNFSELVCELSKKHWIRIDTNLSVEKAFDKFLSLVSPERVIEITYSTHVAERELRHMSIDRLRQSVKRFEDRGFKMSGNYVVYPTFFERIKTDMERFAKHGLTVYPSMFVGRYQDRDYPINNEQVAYKKDELETINSYNPQAITVLNKTKNVLCQAGSAAFFVDPSYDVFPCGSIHKKIGTFFGEWKLFPRVIRCPKQHCYCPFNVTFVSSSITGTQEALLRKTVNAIGVASVFESSLRVTSAYLLTVKILSFMIDRLNLRGALKALKNRVV